MRKSYLLKGIYALRNKIFKINFSGASNTGKSTLCERCAEIYNEPCAPERMRDVMIRRGIGIDGITNDVFVEAAELQQAEILMKENDAKQYLFVDSGPLIFYVGNKYSFGREYPLLKEMALEFYKTQDLVFLCDNNIDFDSSIMRGDEGTKDILQKEVIKFLDENSIRYTMVEGTVEQRVEIVKKELQLLQKRYQSEKNWDEMAEFENLSGGLRVLAKAYGETDVTEEKKREAVRRLYDSYKYLTAKSHRRCEDYSIAKLVIELSKLRKSGVLGRHFEINNPDLFVRSDVVKYAAGLGEFRDLGQTTVMAKCRSVKDKDLFNGIIR